jgi:hypothetical protein
MASEKDIFEVLTILAAAYPRFKLVKETIQAYQMLLRDLGADELRAAAKDTATKRDYFPSVHELRQAVVDMRRRTNRVPTAYEAWHEVITTGPEIRREVVETDEGLAIQSSRYVFSHPLVEQTARLMGWPSKFPSGEDSLMADRAHFLKAYQAAMVDAMEQEITLPEVREFIETRQQQQLEDGQDD